MAHQCARLISNVGSDPIASQPAVPPSGLSHFSSILARIPIASLGPKQASSRLDTVRSREFAKALIEVIRCYLHQMVPVK